ncbi:MAG: hypothetical protein UR15_C0014G0008 [Parcubacteria group bacterium GW2011_GWA2_31_28]|nr:MAG: hypothetical protein UR15_C0014G0008 [Parcubacteria group bacterium GW2011_GWA2_31_28]
MKHLKYIIPLIIIISIFLLWIFSNSGFTVLNKANINLTDIDLKNTVRYNNKDKNILFPNSEDATIKLEIEEYIKKTDTSIPLTVDSLKFAIVNATIGSNELLLDAIVKLDQGKQNLIAITPPKELVQTHKLFLELLDNYGKILKDIVNVPRKEFNPKYFENRFTDIEKIVKQIEKKLGSRKLKILLFYWEAIGK